MSDQRSRRRQGFPDIESQAPGGHVGQVDEFEDPATTMVPPEKEGPTVSADMQVLIGRQLRAVYDDIATQPVPNRFVELLQQLDSKPL